MIKYQLAKLVEWAGTLRTRKRMQKVAYLLQEAGAPFNLEYGLHIYGPYSEELARLTDIMVQTKLLEEKESPNAAGRQYDYALGQSMPMPQVLRQFEASTDGKRHAEGLAAFEDLFVDLNRAETQELELAATIVFFFRQKPEAGLDNAVSAACEFKKDLRRDLGPLTGPARSLAEKSISFQVSTTRLNRSA